MNDISDQALFNPDLMKFVSTKAGENARDDMKSVQDENVDWRNLYAASFRGGSARNRDSGRAFQNLTSAIAFRGLEGGKREDGKLKTNMTSRFTDNNGKRNLAVANEALQAPENGAIVDMLRNYQSHAFDGSDARTNQLSEVQRSAMVMGNVLNSFGAAAGSAARYNGGSDGGMEESIRMMNMMNNTMLATEDATRRVIDGAPNGQGQADRDAGDEFLRLLAR